MRKSITLIVLLVLTGACGSAPQEDAAQDDPQSIFWANLQSLCGRAYEGRLADVTPGDTVFPGRTLVMHVRQCSENEVRVPFHVGNDHSRTWIITRIDGGLRLKHDHRHEDGSEDEITQYGGDTQDAGTAQRQEFHADAHTIELIPAAATNIWTKEIVPGSLYVYALRREGTERRVRVEFDLTREVDTPPTPWGH
jgi:hypothetical protein